MSERAGGRLLGADCHAPPRPQCAIFAAPNRGLYPFALNSRLGALGGAVAEKLILVGLIPEVMVIHADEQVVWISDAGHLKVEFDPKRCPFSSNVFQAPAGMRLMSGTPRPGTKPSSYKYRLWLNDQLIGGGEIILREK